jgi:hypothetical protein
VKPSPVEILRDDRRFERSPEALLSPDTMPWPNTTGRLIVKLPSAWTIGLNW